MQTVVGILTFKSRKNFMLRLLKHEPSFITSRPGFLMSRPVLSIRCKLKEKECVTSLGKLPWRFAFDLCSKVN